MIGNTAVLPTPAFTTQRKRNKKNPSAHWRRDLFVMKLLPGEADHTHDVDDDHSHGNYIAEDGLHPVLDLQALALVGFSQQVFPAPAIALVAAKTRSQPRADSFHPHRAKVL